MNELITIQNDELTISHRVVAENTANNHQSIKRLIDEHKVDFEEFGAVRFEIEGDYMRNSFKKYIIEKGIK